MVKRVVGTVVPDEAGTHGGDGAREQGTRQQAEHDKKFALGFRQLVDQHVNPDVYACTDAIGGAKFGHPYKQVDGGLLCPSKVQSQQPILDGGLDTAHVPM